MRIGTPKAICIIGWCWQRLDVNIPFCIISVIKRCIHTLFKLFLLLSIKKNVFVLSCNLFIHGYWHLCWKYEDGNLL